MKYIDLGHLKIDVPHFKLTIAELLNFICRTDKKFYQLYKEGRAYADDIHDYIDDWHESDSLETIYEYLGMTQEEYRYWVQYNKFLGD